MGRWAKRTLALVFLTPVALGVAFGSGYSVYEQGAEAMANAGAFTARADDPSALFFNPAGILQLEGIQASIGTTAIVLTGSEFDSATSGSEFEQEDNIAWPSTLYYTQRLADAWAWGLGVTSPFGLKTEWGPSFEGRFISRESNLAVVNVNANLARKLGKGWSGAVGLNYARADIRELSRNIDLTLLVAPGVEGFSKLTGDAGDVGWNLALQWASENGWRWGGSYRSRMTPEIKGEVDFQDIPAPQAPLFPDGGARAELPLPASLATGVAHVHGRWEGEFDVVWTDWSQFDRLRIDLEKNTSFVGIPVVTDVDQLEEWEDSYSFRAGYSYHITDHHEYRLGFYLDRNPIPNDHVRPRLPDADRTSAQVGYGYRGVRFTIDVAYQALFFDDRDARGNPNSPSDPVAPGHYENFTSLVGASLGWKF